MMNKRVAALEAAEQIIAGRIKYKLPPLVSMRMLRSLFRIEANSQLSQNFLMAQSISDSIAREALPPLLVAAPSFDLDSLFVEIGPGPGGLSRAYLRCGAPRVVAVEKDGAFDPLLAQLRDGCPGHFSYIIDDALTADQQSLYSKIVQHAIALKSKAAQLRIAEAAEQIANTPVETNAPGSVKQSNPVGPGFTTPILVPKNEDQPDILQPFSKVHIVGNLPFGIVSPLMEMWMEQAANNKLLFSHQGTCMTLMMQQQVAERFAAKPGSKLRGRQAVLSQAIFDVKITKIVRPIHFTPRPEVHAAVIKFVPPKKRALPQDIPFSLFRRVANIMCVQPNKTIGKVLKMQGLGKLAKLLKDLDIDPTARAFNLNIQPFVTVARECLNNPRLLEPNAATSASSQLPPSSKSPA